jgi:hypothetical protein
MGPLSEESSPEPTSPGYDLEIEEGTYFDDSQPLVSVQPHSGNGAAVGHDTIDYGDSDPGDSSSLPPQFPDVLRALENASQPAPVLDPSQPLDAYGAPPASRSEQMLAPPVAISKHPSFPSSSPSMVAPRPKGSGVQLTPMVLVVMILGLVALGIVIGILLTRS